MTHKALPPAPPQGQERIKAIRQRLENGGYRNREDFGAVDDSTAEGAIAYLLSELVASPPAQEQEPLVMARHKMIVEARMKELPKRSAPELIDALRQRAALLTGEKWERTATADMMREAADMLEKSALPPAHGWHAEKEKP